MGFGPIEREAIKRKGQLGNLGDCGINVEKECLEPTRNLTKEGLVCEKVVG